MLKYIGDGSFIPGVPARDLTEEEVKEYGLKYLLLSGLYAEEPKENKMILPKEDKKGVN